MNKPKLSDQQLRDRLLKKPLDRLLKLFWVEFSLYIRTSQDNCYTCGKYVPTEEANAGHYIHGGTRGNLASWLLDSDERNIHKQCVKCNKYLSGNAVAYALHLEAEYGQGILQELAALRWKVYTPSEQEVVDKILLYRNKVNSLQS